MPVVETERHGQILVVRMNRPERLNALNQEMRTQLAETWTEFRHSNELEVAIFTGAGRAFCAGEDMKESLANGAPGGRRPAIEDPFMSGALEKPVIAAVNGFAMGGSPSERHGAVFVTLFRDARTDIYHHRRGGQHWRRDRHPARLPRPRGRGHRLLRRRDHERDPLHEAQRRRMGGVGDDQVDGVGHRHPASSSCCAIGWALTLYYWFSLKPKVTAAAGPGLRRLTADRPAARPRASRPRRVHRDPDPPAGEGARCLPQRTGRPRRRSRPGG